jgi:hypothetical protein
VRWSEIATVVGIKKDRIRELVERVAEYGLKKSAGTGIPGTLLWHAYVRVHITCTCSKRARLEKETTGEASSNERLLN